MKHLALTTILLGSLLVASTSQALVRVVTTCQTQDNLYRISILDNEGIGPVRTSHFYANIYNAQGLSLATYAVASNASQVKSISFGQGEYTDIETGGQKFFMALGSTNYRHITLRATLFNGGVLSELDPVCK